MAAADDGICRAVAETILDPNCVDTRDIKHGEIDRSRRERATVADTMAKLV